jgi:hypothetical protein
VKRIDVHGGHDRDDAKQWSARWFFIELPCE